MLADMDNRIGAPCITQPSIERIVMMGGRKIGLMVNRLCIHLITARRLQCDKRIDRKSTRLNSSHQINSYAVFCSKKKMIIHGDGKSNIFNEDCFKSTELVKSFKPTIALLNPPFNDGSGIDELEFVEQALSCLEPN